MDWIELFFDRQTPPQRLGTILLFATFAVLMFGPLAFGAVEPWSIFLVELGAASLLVAWSIQQAKQGQIVLRANPLFPPMFAFGGLILLQLILRRSAYTHETVNGALTYAAYGMLAFLVSQLFLRKEQVRIIAIALTCYGTLIACFALLQGVASNGKLYWLRQPTNGGWIYGPYVNHNHYAGLMEMLVPIPLVISLSKLADEKQRATAAVAAALMAGTIFLSGSRGGMAALLVELAILAVLLTKQQKGPRTALMAGIFSLVIIAVLVWLGGRELSHRLATVTSASHTDISNNMRMNLNRDSVRMFMQRPILGWGLRTYPVASPQFRTFYTNFFVNEAHNDYLQLLVEMGVLGFATMVWFLVSVFRAGMAKLPNWSTDMNGAIAAASLLGVCGILVHSLVDFNLQIPANAAWFYVMCTLAASAKLVQPVRRRKPVAPMAEQVSPVSEAG